MTNAAQIALPTAIIFDMDGLMLDTEKIYQSVWQRAANDLGRTIREDLFAQLVGLRTEDCESLILDALGQDFPLASFHARWMELWVEEAVTDGIDLKPGLLELLDRIDSLGIAKAVATSSTRLEAQRSLGASGLSRRFTVVVTGDEVARGKPAPDIFEEAARRLQTPPTDCWAFEDSSAGAMAASSAGMAVYIVPDLIAPTAEATGRSAAVLPSLHQALPLLT